ncbi:Gas vesicle protein [Paenibacillus sophorae]|uniref:Gas vesicle protein n=1 Tax=Paenibacillus sophorae TaxID=1333845 RepID=A0A1H8TU45_9BACL|nr:YtxH domain-containing protein [Paenibacillus sophorae]QWU18032.1 YtxH domain-containing protein [Paenibacillus sophorae]SEO94391.1 Gas vesicle protein [Paenibacillus sophorae]
MKKNTKSLLWGIVAGGAVGSVTALLLAPKSGKELRKDISDGAAATVDKAQELVHQASDKTVEWYGKAKDSVEQVIQEVTDWSKQFTKAEDEAAVISAADIDSAAGSSGPGDEIDSSAADDTGEKA